MLPPIDDQTSTYEPTVYCGHPKSSYDCSNMFKACWENIQIYIYIHHTIIHINYNQSDWPTKKSRMLCIFLYHETPHFHLLGSTGFKPSIVWRIWWVHPISISRKNCWLPSNPPFISIYEHFPLKP